MGARVCLHFKTRHFCNWEFDEIFCRLKFKSFEKLFKMLASDSDSEFEFANNTGHGNGSEASDDEGILLGKLALGIDPQEMKSYDVKSEPKNGSQYLMQVMAEKKAVPKVVSVGVPEPKPKQGVNYLDKFLQVSRPAKTLVKKLATIKL